MYFPVFFSYFFQLNNHKNQLSPLLLQIMDSPIMDYGFMDFFIEYFLFVIFAFVLFNLLVNTEQ